MVYTWGLLQLTVAGLLAGYSKVVVHGLYLGTATVAGLLARYSKVVVNLIFYSLYIFAPALSLPFPPIFFVSYL